MPNSLLLRIAVGLCAANVVVGLWSAWSLSSTRGRLARAEQVAVDDSKASEGRDAALGKQLMELEKRVEGMRKELDRIDRVVFPPPGK